MNRGNYFNQQGENNPEFLQTNNEQSLPNPQFNGVDQGINNFQNLGQNPAENQINNGFENGANYNPNYNQNHNPNYNNFPNPNYNSGVSYAQNPNVNNFSNPNLPNNFSNIPPQIPPQKINTARPLPIKITYDTSFGKKGFAVLMLAILSLISVFSLGFLQEKNKIEDIKKEKDILQIIKALNTFYNDSNEFVEKKFYPIGACSGELNSFDYEHTLRKALTGGGLNAKKHVYIKPENWPFDEAGSYTTNLNDYAGTNPKNTNKKVADLGVINCFHSLSNFEKENLKNKYFDGGKICKFDNKREPMKFDFFTQKNCYLYTSTITGDQYKLAYYSKPLQKFVVYSQYRNGKLSTIYSE